MTAPIDAFQPKPFLKTVTTNPGVYQMYNQERDVIYVGKAKNLKNRLSSYFQKNISGAKTRALVKQIAYVEVIVTETEAEALILENNLIKQFQPKYNILLRDDKSYPYLIVTNHKHPKVGFFRGSKKQKGEHFGPYPSSGAVWESLRILQKIFPVRQCEDGFYQARTRPCLQHQMKRCLAPCVKGYVSDQEYSSQVNLLKTFLRGNSTEVLSSLVSKMEAASQNLEFEQAVIYRDQITTLQKITEKQNVAGNINEVDIIAFAIDGGLAVASVIYVRQNKILGNKNYFPKVPNNSDPHEIISAFITQFYLNEVGGQSIPNLIIVPEQFSEHDSITTAIEQIKGKKVEVVHAKRGEKLSYFRLAEKNAQVALQARISDGRGWKSKYKELSTYIKLPNIQRMECFDISHTFGEYPIASCVVFNQDGPLKTEYRRYNVKGVKGGDDYGAMQFALNKRFGKLTSSENVPDVLLIDGGKGQLRIAERFFGEWQLEKKPVIVGVAKGEGRKPGLETLYMNGGEISLDVPSNSQALHLVQHIRDESHRFAIAGHRNKRNKAKSTSTLQGIPGVGAKRRQAILKFFGGMQGVKSATVRQLKNVPGISEQLANEIHAFLHDKR